MSMPAVTPHNGEISCSIEETNRIRISLGLKPLRQTSTSKVTLAAPSKAPQPKPVSPKPKRDHFLFDIAESASDSDGDNEINLSDWVNRSRKVATKTESKEPKNELVPTDSKVEDPAQHHVQLNLPNAPDLEEGDSMVFTLADADVCAEEEDVLQIPGAKGRNSPEKDEDGVDAEGGKSRSIKISFRDGKASSVEETTLINKPAKQSIEEKPPQEKSVTFAVPKVESDYKTDPFKSVAHKSRSQKPKKKRKRRRETSADASDEMRAQSEAPVSKGHMAALRAKVSTAAADDDDDDDDEHYALLARAHRLSKEKRLAKASEVVLNAIERIKEDNLDEADRDGSMKIVYDEMEQFMHSIPAPEVQSDSEEEKADLPNAVEPIHTSSAKPPEHEMEVEPEPGVEETIKEENTKNIQPTAPLDLTEDTAGGLSVAATLQRLRAMGELKHKPVQRGRARDARFSEDVMGNGEETRDIKLSYLDDYGNELTPKEAFRVLCHKFHGHKPGQNKKEKRMRKMLEALRVQQMQSDDTPLASAAALKEETKKLGSAHVVLSGSQALRQQTLERPVLTKSVQKVKKAEVSKPNLPEQNGIESKANSTEQDRGEKKVAFSFGIEGNGALKRRRR